MISMRKRVLLALSIPWTLVWAVGVQFLLGVLTPFLLAVDLTFTAIAAGMYVWILSRLRDE
jgi:hypothetical protein